MNDAPKFTIAYDPAKRRLLWTMRGFWDPSDVGALGAAMRATVSRLGPPPYNFDSLSDARDFPVQSKEVAEALSAVQHAAQAINQGRMAVVVSSMMNKLQAQRTLGARVHVFLSMAEAVAWLDEMER